MKFRAAKLGFLRGLLALALSVALIASSHAFAFASFNNSNTDQFQNDDVLLSASALMTEAGVRLEWSSKFDPQNLGFNVYRLEDGKRIRVNREIIPGSVFQPGPNDIRLSQRSYSYGWLDPSGTADSVYYVESVSISRESHFHQPLTPFAETRAPGKKRSLRENGSWTLASGIKGPGDNLSADAGGGSYEVGYPAAKPAATSAHMSASTIEDQWSIAGQPAVKIAIRKDGWYRVTQPQMAAVGFNPTVDIRNLQLFVDGQEVAINTSQSGGLFGPADYFEFFGRGLDVPSSDVRTYYLIAAASPGKRVRGELQIDSPAAPAAPPAPSPAAPTPSPANSPVPKAKGYVWRWTKLLISASQPLSMPFIPLIMWRIEARIEKATKNQSPEPNTPEALTPLAKPEADPSGEIEVSAKAEVVAPVAVEMPARAKKAWRGSPRKKAGKNRVRREISEPKREYSHARMSVAAAVAPSNFASTVERKDRSIYFSKLLNGDQENWFGRVISTIPVSQTVNTPNPAFSAPGPARLEIKLQGVNPVTHQVEVKFNDVALGTLTFFGEGSPVQVFDVPLSLLKNGPNIIKFTPASGVSLVNYTRITYPKAFRADTATGNLHLNGQPNLNDTLSVGDKTYTFVTSPSSELQIGIGFTLADTAANIATRINSDTTSTHCSATPLASDVILTGTLGAGNAITLTVDGVRLTKTAFANGDKLALALLGTQTLQVDGFSSSNVQLIDYTDPFNVSLSKPEFALMGGGGGYAITVPASTPTSKTQRLFYAFAGEPQQAAAISLNQPSTLNLSANTADFLIITTRTLYPHLAPLVAAREAQGMNVDVVDVEDVYDEFSYGVHGPQAIKDFLARANTVWATKPQYVIFAGDATYDPRNYSGDGNFDLVPTKLIDATYNETASDDWLTDFDNNGIADIPIGRLPVRTPAELDLVVSKIVNFTPVAPESAMLVADDPTGYYFNFEQANDQVQTQLPGSMAVQRVNVRTVGPASAKTNIIAGFNEGRALVNYTGHGNVDVWSGAAIFKTADALALTNGNKLSFVIVMDCLNGYYHAPVLLSLSEGFLKAPQGGAVAAFASSGLTLPDGQHEMSTHLYSLLYGAQPIALGDAIKIAKGATNDVDVRRTWIFFGDPSMKIR